MGWKNVVLWDTCFHENFFNFIWDWANVLNRKKVVCFTVDCLLAGKKSVSVRPVNVYRQLYTRVDFTFGWTSDDTGTNNGNAEIRAEQWEFVCKNKRTVFSLRPLSLLLSYQFYSRKVDATRFNIYLYIVTQSTAEMRFQFKCCLAQIFGSKPSGNWIRRDRNSRATAFCFLIVVCYFLRSFVSSAIELSCLTETKSQLEFPSRLCESLIEIYKTFSQYSLVIFSTSLLTYSKMFILQKKKRYTNIFSIKEKLKNSQIQ